MRIVRTPTGEVRLDGTGRAAGRGAYVCRTTDCLDKAISKGALSRALKTALPADLRDALTGSLDPMNTTIEGGARGQE
jgi:predicted RNA-binding protein YlxR (DUF448 family)